MPTIDSVDAGGHNSSGGTSITATWSHTCSGSNRLLVVFLTVGESSSTLDFSTGTFTVTYNGVNMTLWSPGRIFPNNTSTTGVIAVFYMINPPTGAHTVSITYTNTGSFGYAIQGGGISWNGASQSAPIGNTGTNTGSGTSGTVNVTVGGANASMGGITDGSGGTTVSGGSAHQTKQLLLSSGNDAVLDLELDTNVVDTGTVTYGWTFTNDFWAQVALEIVAAAATTPPLTAAPSRARLRVPPARTEVGRPPPPTVPAPRGARPADVTRAKFDLPPPRLLVGRPPPAPMGPPRPFTPQQVTRAKFLLPVARTELGRPPPPTVPAPRAALATVSRAKFLLPRAIALRGTIPASPLAPPRPALGLVTRPKLGRQPSAMFFVALVPRGAPFTPVVVVVPAWAWKFGSQKEHWSIGDH